MTDLSFSLHPDLLAQTGNTLLHGVIGLAMLLVSLFLIGLVMIQQGKGGGLAGSLGGMGGASALGTRADRQVMYVTVGVAAVWFVLCILGIVCLANPSGPSSTRLDVESGLGATETIGPAEGDVATPDTPGADGSVPGTPPAGANAPTESSAAPEAPPATEPSSPGPLPPATDGPAPASVPAE